MLRQIFIRNLKEFRKKEGLTQMKLAELCDISFNYIGEIEIGRKFPSIEMIEKLAGILRIEPYHLFKNRVGKNSDSDPENAYPSLPNAMKTELKNKIDTSISEILRKY
jgi:transcriptional regulator with XRE-family HTH domain